MFFFFFFVEKHRRVFLGRHWHAFRRKKMSCLKKKIVTGEEKHRHVFWSIVCDCMRPFVGTLACKRVVYGNVMYGR